MFQLISINIFDRLKWFKDAITYIIVYLWFTYEPQHKTSNNVVYATSKGSDQSAHTRSLIRAFASRLIIL